MRSWYFTLVTTVFTFHASCYREEVLCSPNTCIWKKLGIYQYSKRSYLDRHCYERCRAETSSKCTCYPTQTSNGAVHFLVLIIDSCRFSFKSSCLLVPSDCQRSEKACMGLSPRFSISCHPLLHGYDSYMKYLPTRRSKMADITEDINFDDLCSTCEQMELDVSEV